MFVLLEWSQLSVTIHNIHVATHNSYLMSDWRIYVSSFFGFVRDFWDLVFILLSINVRYKVVNIETRNWKHEGKRILPALDHRLSGWRGSESTTIWNTWSFPEWATPSSFHFINLLFFSVSTSGSPQREPTEIRDPFTALQKGMPSTETFLLATTKDNHSVETFTSHLHPLSSSSSLYYH